MAARKNMKYYPIILFFLLFTSTVKGQQIQDSINLDDLIQDLEICYRSDLILGDYQTIQYCKRDKKILQVSYDKNMQIYSQDNNNISIYHYVYDNGNLIQINTYTSDFTRPDTGFASWIYKYTDDKVIERLAIDRKGKLSGYVSRLQNEYNGDIIVSTQYDRYGNPICAGDAFRASTRIYTLDSLDRIVKIEYWCKSYRPYKLLGKEIIEYIDDPKDYYNISYFDTDSVYINEKTFTDPYYFRQY